MNNQYRKTSKSNKTKKKSYRKYNGKSNKSYRHKKFNRTKEERQAWWRSLSAEEQSKHLERWEKKKEEKRHKPAGTKKAGLMERLPYGDLKVWRDDNCFTIYKKSMLDENGYPKKLSENKE